MSRDFCRRLVPPVFFVLFFALATIALAERPGALPGTVVDSVTGQAWQPDAPGVQTLDLEGATQTRFTGVEGLESMRDHLEKRLVTALEFYLADPDERSNRLEQYVGFLRTVEDAIAEAAANPEIAPRIPEKAKCSSNFTASTGPASFPGCGNTASASAYYDCRQDCEVMTDVFVVISTCTGGHIPDDWDTCTDSTFPYSCSTSVTLYNPSPGACDALAESYLICPGTGPYGLLMASDYGGGCNCYAC